MRAFPVEDHAVGEIAHLGRHGAVQVADAIHRQLFGARHGADARHQLAFGIVALAGDHGAMQRQVDGIQPFGQRLFQHRLHLAPESFEHGMIHGARGAAGIDGAGHHLPAFAFGHRKKTVHLRGIAAAAQNLLAAMDHKAVQPRDCPGKGMGFVENSGEKNTCHVITPDKLSVVFGATASAGALHHWRAFILRSPCSAAGADLLILKLTIVPLALWLFGVIERAHGPRVAGWLAGFPIVGGPLLAFITLDHGNAFGSQAALGAYFGLVPWLAFTATYAFCARRLNPLLVHRHRLCGLDGSRLCRRGRGGPFALAGDCALCRFSGVPLPLSARRAVGRGARACLVGPAGPHAGRRGTDDRDHPIRRDAWARAGPAFSPPFP